MPHATLTQISQRVPLSEIEGLAENVGKLVADGYVKVMRDEQLRPILVEITPKGKDFLAAGGYKAERKRRIIRSLLRYLRDAIFYLLGLTTSLIASRLFG